MMIPDGVPYDNRDDYRNGYADGYAGREGQQPTEFVFDRFLAGLPNIKLPMDHPKVKAYWRGWEDGRRKFKKLKGGV